MTTDSDFHEGDDQENLLRQRAEDALKGSDRGSDTSASPLDALKLMYELQVHQIELELQNAELIRARAELEDSLEKYTDLYGFAPVGYMTLDCAGFILQLNLTAAHIFHTERSNLIGRRLDTLVSPQSVPVLKDYLKRVLLDVRPRHCEIQIPILDHLVLDLRLTASAMPGGDKCRLAFEDITTLKRIEAELIRSEGNLTHAQQIAHLGSWQFNPHTRQFAWSAEVYKIFGRNPSLELPDLIGWRNLILTDDWDSFDRAFQLALHQDADLHLELSIVRPDGEVRKVEMLSECVKDSQGRLVEISGSIQDITERKRMENQLRAALAEKEWLMREVHHRVKNNLEVVASLISLQTHRVSDPTMQAGLLDLQQRVYTMSLVHEQLYRSDVLTHVDAQDYLERLVLGLNQALGGPDIQISVEARPIQLEIDQAISLGLIANELVSNAFKHAFGDSRNRLVFPAENGHAQISVSLEQAQDKLVLTVSDNGVGLPADLDWQATRTLGMRLINRLSEQLHGELTVSNQVGTCFTLIFGP